MIPRIFITVGGGQPRTPAAAATASFEIRGEKKASEIARSSIFHKRQRKPQKSAEERMPGFKTDEVARRDFILLSRCVPDFTGSENSCADRDD